MQAKSGDVDGDYLDISCAVEAVWFRLGLDLGQRGRGSLWTESDFLTQLSSLARGMPPELLYREIVYP